MNIEILHCVACCHPVCQPIVNIYLVFVQIRPGEFLLVSFNPCRPQIAKGPSYFPCQTQQLVQNVPQNKHLNGPREDVYLRLEALSVLCQ